MLFDKQKVLDGVALNMAQTDKTRVNDILLALGLCLDDLSDRLRSTSQLREDTVLMTTGSTEVELSNTADDLKYLSFIKYDIPGNVKSTIPQYYRPEDFVSKYQAVDDTEDMPTAYTIMTSDDGFPIIRFNTGFPEDTNIIVTYYMDLTPDSIGFGRGVARLVMGTRAWFYGIETALGAAAYKAFLELVGVARGADSFKTAPIISSTMNSFDQELRECSRDLRRSYRG